MIGKEPEETSGELVILFLRDCDTGVFCDSSLSYRLMTGVLFVYVCHTVLKHGKTFSPVW